MRHLNSGDTVGIISPSGPLPLKYRKQHQFVINELERRGFSVLDLSHEEFDPDREAETIVRAIENPDISALFPICGNPIIHETVQSLGKIQFQPRDIVMCGYSEMTALLSHLHSRSVGGLFSGPHLNFLNEKSSNRENWFSIYSFWNMLMAQSTGSKFIKKRHEKYCYYRKDRGLHVNIYEDAINRLPEKMVDLTHCFEDPRDFKGEILCFTLEVLMEMLKYENKIDFRGKIVICDTLNKSLEEITKMFQKLSLLTNISQSEAIIFNACFRTDNKDDLGIEAHEIKNLRMVIEDITQTAVIHGFPYGHCRYKLTLPIGGILHYSCTQKKFEIST